jgi:hypothetical protein
MKSRKLARSDLLSPLLVLALVAVLVAVLGPSSPLVAQAGQRPHAGATVLSWAERGAPRLPGVSVRLPAEWDARRVVAPVQWEPVGPSLSIERGEGGYLLAPRGQSLSGHPQPLTMVQEHNSVPLRVGIPALILLGVDLTRLEPASSVEVTVTTNAAAYRIEVRETAAVAAVEAEVVSGGGGAAAGPRRDRS